MEIVVAIAGAIAALGSIPGYVSAWRQNRRNRRLGFLENENRNLRAQLDRQAEIIEKLKKRLIVRDDFDLDSILSDGSF